MASFQPPPTYAPIFVKEITSGELKFNPIWLKWFVDLTRFVTLNGGGGAVDLTTINGLVARVASGLYAARTITGTAAEVGVTNGDGVAGNPVIDIAPHLAASDPHTQYILKTLFAAKGSLLAATAAATPADLPVGTNGQVLTADSTQASGMKWAVATSPVGDVLRNLQASASGTNATINISADAIAVVDSSFAGSILQNVSVAINSAASGANGLDTGTLAASTWYSKWIIYNGVTTAGLISLSATAPTLPSGYTFKKRTGWIRTDGTANKYPLSFLQLGTRTQYKIASGSNITGMPLMASYSAAAVGNVATPTWVAVSVSGFVPSTARFISFVSQMSTDTNEVCVCPNNNYGAYTSTTNPPPFVNAPYPTAGSAKLGGFQLESTNIYWANLNTNGNGQLFCLSWEDNL